MSYHVYILRCEDGSFYTGITTDVERRFAEHVGAGAKAARYTRSHRAVSVEGVWDASDRAEASLLEYRVKRLSHDEKQDLVDNPAMMDALRSASGQGEASR